MEVHLKRGKPERGTGCTNRSKNVNDTRKSRNFWARGLAALQEHFLGNRRRSLGEKKGAESKEKPTEGQRETPSKRAGPLGTEFEKHPPFSIAEKGERPY